MVRPSAMIDLLLVLTLTFGMRVMRGVLSYVCSVVDLKRSLSFVFECASRLASEDGSLEHLMKSL